MPGSIRDEKKSFASLRNAVIRSVKNSMFYRLITGIHQLSFNSLNELAVVQGGEPRNVLHNYPSRAELCDDIHVRENQTIARVYAWI